MKGKHRLRLLVPALLAALLLAGCGGGSGGSGDTTAESSAVAYLRQLEQGDPDQVIAVIRQQRQARLEAELVVLRDQLLNGEADVWSMFEDYLILGDSRAVGFAYFTPLPSERILADAGDKITSVAEHMDDILAYNPARIYIAYGINDINIGFWPTVEDYIEEMENVLGQVRENLPDVEIYVNSILPVEDWALYKGAMWKYVPEWNEVIGQACEENGWTFIDNAEIVAEHQEYYETDGIHFQSGFYPYWATNMILATYFRDAEEALDA